MKMPEMNKDDMLAALGLQVKPTRAAGVTEALALFGVGVVVGAATALLLAPKSGRELRTDIERKIKRAKDVDGPVHVAERAAVDTAGAGV